MDVMLLGLAVVSLVVAFILGVAAWRLARAERGRSAARVAALAAAAQETDPPVARPSPRPVSAPVSGEDEDVPASWTFPSRVTPLAAAPRAYARAQELALRNDPAVDAPLDWPDLRTERTAAIRDSFLGAEATRTPSHGGQRLLAVAAAGLLVGLAGTATWTFMNSASGVRSGAVSAPLELVSLTHERQGTKLAVSGLVRNPMAGHPVDRLTAVVFLFDQNGTFVTSAQATADFLRLAPGDETPFVIQVDAPASVTRYRVSFRTNDGVVPHVDRREQAPVSPASLESDRSVTLSSV